MVKTFTWDINAGLSKTTEVTASSVKFGDGYEQVTSQGINNVRDNLSVTITEQIETINDIYDFLTEHKGVTPFYVSINDRVGLYRTTGEIGQSHVGFDVWSITFNLKQVFKP